VAALRRRCRRLLAARLRHSKAMAKSCGVALAAESAAGAMA